MTRPTPWLALLPLLAACPKETPEDRGVELRNQYTAALCRFYTDSECIDNIDNSCGFTFTFDDPNDCQPFFNIILSSCSGYLGGLVENEETVLLCVSQLEGFDCVNDDYCDTGGSEFINTGACAAVDAIIQSYCPEDTASR